ncbi:MAG TPA: glycosyltransferase family 2 protein [Burkholderiales bacterium]|nr:glycosyltransferase family 2 protein [Burkholderiales bacterium]
MSLPVSAVVPCYRSAATVERAVQSVAAQSARPLELILVDDGSGDGTLDKLHELRARLGEDWVRVVALGTNRGPSAARNAGWDAARGRYVAFLDADDTWHPRKLELQHAFMEAHPQIALSGHRHATGRHPELPPEAPAWRTVTFRQLLVRNLIVVPSVMVRREVAARFREGQRHMEDHLLFLQLAARGEGLALLEAPLAALYKPQMGASGLSGQLLAMERGELSNYRLLFREGWIGAPALLALWGWSLVKFARRLAIVALRRISGSRSTA